MAEHRYKYNYLPCPGHVTGHEFDSDYGLDRPAGIAGDAARHLYCEREHSYSWAHTLVIWELDGKAIGTFNVDCDDAPQFDVREVRGTNSR